MYKLPLEKSDYKRIDPRTGKTQLVHTSVVKKPKETKQKVRELIDKNPEKYIKYFDVDSMRDDFLNNLDSARDRFDWSVSPGAMFDPSAGGSREQVEYDFINDAVNDASDEEILKKWFDWKDEKIVDAEVNSAVETYIGG